MPLLNKTNQIQHAFMYKILRLLNYEIFKGMLHITTIKNRTGFFYCLQIYVLQEVPVCNNKQKRLFFFENKNLYIKQLCRYNLEKNSTSIFTLWTLNHMVQP